jgi:transcriptional regulator with XRE-family HTH domain
MITAVQLRAARALLSIDQQTLADLSGVSLATIQRMERSEGNVRGVIDTLTKVVGALTATGIELLRRQCTQRRWRTRCALQRAIFRCPR